MPSARNGSTNFTIKYSIFHAQRPCNRDSGTKARIAEKNARARVEFAARKQDANREAFRFSQERAIDLMKSELARVEAIASANETGAGIMASMATSAMSSANAIAHTIITESA